MERAAAALAAGEWEKARACFESELADRESPERLAGLGTALWWLGETDAAVTALERAFAGFRYRPDPPSASQAARAALMLCLLYGSSLGNLAAAHGWVERLARVVEQHDLVPMRGWLALCRAAHANTTADPADAEAHAGQALEAARLTGDTDLELCALSEVGYALVQVGRVAEGTALLDEAMAGALGGEARELSTVVFAGCRSITSCSRVLEFGRAAQWIHAADRFSRRYGNLHLYTTCRTVYGNLLVCQGRWEEAEGELRAALRIGKNAEPALYGETLAALAELRIAQGRLGEAEEFLRGYEDQPAAVLPRARIHLRRGEAEVAAALLRRRLDAFGQDCVEAAPLCELAADAEIATGDVRAAAERASRLLKTGERAGCLPVLARGLRALGRASLAGGDDEAAAGQFGRALDVFTRLGMPLDVAQAHLLLARALRGRGSAAAVAEARTALAAFEDLGAAPGADQAAALLRDLGVRATRRQAVALSSAAAQAPALSRREQEVLTLLSEGLSNRDIAERLFLTRKTIEHHVRGLFAKLGVANRAEATAYAVRRQAGGR
jgi:ATP/maltotriose-dependent transcriptional regulator MalT